MEGKWTTKDIPDLQNQNVIVTGANSGIGYETAKELARKGARVILACRNRTRSADALNAIRTELPQAAVEMMELDLADLLSIRRFAHEYKSRYAQLHILINNAGIMMGPYRLTVDGFERQFGTNHLGHFALTGLLLNLLLKTPNARVVSVSSTAHHFGTMDFGNLMYAKGKGYFPARAYARSKLANLLYTYELQRRLDAKGVDTISVACHPGLAYTNLTKQMPGQWFLKMTAPLQKVILQSAAMGALPTLRAACDPLVKGGEFYGPDGFREQRGYPVLVESSPASHNVDDSRKLWEISEQLTGVLYELLE